MCLIRVRRQANAPAGFTYLPTPKYIEFTHKDGAWDGGTVTEGNTIEMHVMSGCLHYGEPPLARHTRGFP